MNKTPGEITQLLREMRLGEPGAQDALMERVYEDLRTIARSKLSKYPPGHTLQATALVGEAYLKVFGKADPPDLENRNHLFWALSRAMRDVLVDSAKAHCALKRGGDRDRVPMTNDLASVDNRSREIIAIDSALIALLKESKRAHEVVVLKYFGELSIPMIAEILGVSEATVGRDWAFARAWMKKFLNR